MVFNIEVRWLSRSAKNNIQLFLDMKGYAFSHFDNKEWMCDIHFSTSHRHDSALNDLNVELQGKGKLFCCIIKFRALEQIKIVETVSFAE